MRPLHRPAQRFRCSTAARPRLRAHSRKLGASPRAPRHAAPTQPAGLTQSCCHRRPGPTASGWTGQCRSRPAGAAPPRHIAPCGGRGERGAPCLLQRPGGTTAAKVLEPHPPLGTVYLCRCRRPASLSCMCWPAGAPGQLFIEKHDKACAGRQCGPPGARGPAPWLLKRLAAAAPHGPRPRSAQGLGKAGSANVGSRPRRQHVAPQRSGCRLL